MEIDIYSYLTDEEREQMTAANARIDSANAEIRALWEDIETTAPSVEAAAAYVQSQPIYADKLEDEQLVYRLELEAERRYINEHLNTTDAIVDSAKLVLADVTKDQYLQWQARRTEALKQLVEARADEGDEVADFRQRAKEGSIASPNNAVMFLLQLLTTQLNACEYMQDTIANDLLWSLAGEKAAGFFPTQKRPFIEPPTAQIWENDFMPEWDAKILREFLGLKKSDFRPIKDINTNDTTLTAKTTTGEVRLNQAKDAGLYFLGHFGTMALKLVDLGVETLTAFNYAYAPVNNLQVNINLKKFAEEQGRNIEAPEGATDKEKEQALNRRKAFINEIHNNLSDLARFSLTENTGGTTVNTLGIIQASHSISHGYITYYMDQRFAEHLRRSGIVFQQPRAIMRIPNDDRDAYIIGRMIANHHSNDNNVRHGTESTLSVRSLISYANDIPSFEELEEKGRRDWRQRIKRRLEEILDEFIDIGFLEKWDYHLPRTGEAYSREAADKLRQQDYKTLMVNYTVKNAPDQTERRARKEAEYNRWIEEQKAAGNEPVKKKRGRPRKQKQEA